MLFLSLICLIPALVYAQMDAITQLPIGTRLDLCANQIATCINSCGSAANAPMKFCNATTLGWGCGCLTNTPPVEPWNWPVASRDCTLNLQSCTNECNSQPSPTSECFNKCTSVWQCNTVNAPVSYLQVSDVSQTPSYAAPNITYAGNIPGTNTPAKSSTAS
ncbi:hypothetical protein BB558_005494, partial [Smittium angustum]